MFDCIPVSFTASSDAPHDTPPSPSLLGGWLLFGGLTVYSVALSLFDCIPLSQQHHQKRRMTLSRARPLRTKTRQQTRCQRARGATRPPPRTRTKPSPCRPRETTLWRPTPRIPRGTRTKRTRPGGGAKVGGRGREMREGGRERDRERDRERYE